MDTPDFVAEAACHARGLGNVAGVDEVGRGPLAGPVTAAAVILDPARIPAGLRDSKTLSRAVRERLAAAVHATARVAIVHVGVDDIDRLDILRASHMAMVQAVAALRADHALIDGNILPRGLSCPGTAIVKGDASCLSIAAASIVAKVARDRIMVDLAQQHPGYGWETNAGYGTAGHLAALRSLGVTPFHRRSFAPVYQMLYQDKSVTP
jgi:ribonuclease HII